MKNIQFLVSIKAMVHGAAFPMQVHFTFLADKTCHCCLILLLHGNTNPPILPGQDTRLVVFEVHGCALNSGNIFFPLFPTLTFWKGFLFGGGPLFHPGMPLKVAPYIEIGVASGLRMRRRELLHLLTEVRGICKRSLN